MSTHQHCIDKTFDNSLFSSMISAKRRKAGLKGARTRKINARKKAGATKP